MSKLLSYREAAKRIGRTTRAIRYMRQDGMPMGWEKRNGQLIRVVEEKILLATWRQRLRNDPAHQYRLRRIREAQQAAQSATRRNPPPPTPGVVSAPRTELDSSPQQRTQ